MKSATDNRTAVTYGKTAKLLGSHGEAEPQTVSSRNSFFFLKFLCVVKGSPDHVQNYGKLQGKYLDFTNIFRV